MSSVQSVAVQHMQHEHVLSEQSGVHGLQPQNIVQYVDWFGSLLPGVRGSRAHNSLADGAGWSL